MTAPSPAMWRLPKRLAYVVSHARPWSSNGYAARTHAMAQALTAAGHEVIVFTRPGRPWDIEGFPAARPVDLDRRIDGIRHISLPLPPLPGARPFERVRARAEVLTEAFYAFRPAAVLAASNWETAEPARRAAGRMGAAFFYEQRGFWEMGGSARAEDEERRAETEIALGARAVFTLNGAMRDELVRRGVPEGRIHLVPNGVPAPGRIDPRVTRAGLGCRAAHLLGYIGSLSAYEGVEDLIEVTARLRQGGAGRPPLDVAALIVGSDAPKGLIGGDEGPAMARLRARAAECGLTGHVHFLPQQPEEATASLYALCDALVLPRRRSRVTELVPPIKPYAAAAFSLPVFLTDLPPLAEIAAEIHGSLFPEGDLDTLAGLLHRALTHGHPATVARLSPDLAWERRVRPVLRQLDLVAEAEEAANRRLFAGSGSGAGSGAGSGSGAAAPPQGPDQAPDRGFDLAALPRWALREDLGAPHEARLGPESAPVPAGATRLTRASLLEVLATAEPGRLVIDWAGLAAAAADGSGRGSDWEGLWSIDNMRLNRQVMDAVRIALSRGWRLQVLGPVPRSEAPLYRTVANVMEEILPADPAPADLGPADPGPADPASAPAAPLPAAEGRA